jgi:hypothetical protein
VFWVLTAVFLIGVWVWGLAQTPLAVHETVLYHTEPIGEIRGGQTVGQTFRAPYNGLYRIEVSLADYGRLNTGPVNFRLGTSPDALGWVIVQTFPAETVRRDVTRVFDFDPLADSAGKDYYFQLDAPEAVPGNAITAYIRPSAPYQDGTAYWTGQPVQSDLVFSLYFKVSLWERIKILLQQMTENKPLFWGDWRFYVGMALLYGALLAALVRELVKLLNRPEAEDEPRRKD